MYLGRISSKVKDVCHLRFIFIQVGCEIGSQVTMHGWNTPDGFKNVLSCSTIAE